MKFLAISAVVTVFILRRNDTSIYFFYRYLKEGKLPDVMSKLQDDAPDSNLIPSQIDMKEEDQDFMGDERTHKTKKSIKSLYTCPINLGDLQVLSLGKVVKDSEFFHTENHIWTEGYTAIRKFPSLKGG